jgi:hypothetical protein
MQRSLAFAVLDNFDPVNINNIIFYYSEGWIDSWIDEHINMLVNEDR